MMYLSVGIGFLVYIVGFKLMDVCVIFNGNGDDEDVLLVELIFVDDFKNYFKVWY